MFFRKKAKPQAEEDQVSEIVRKVKFYGDLLESDRILGKISEEEFVKSRDAFQRDVTNIIGRKIEALEREVFG